jgi:hypothetical protein
MLPEQRSRALKLFCGLPQDRLMKTLKLAYFGKTEQSFLGKKSFFKIRSTNCMKGIYVLTNYLW